MSPRAASLIALSALLGAAGPLLAQEQDPTPFWMGPDAAEAPAVAPARRPKKKHKPPVKKAKRQPAPVAEEPAQPEDEPPPPPKRAARKKRRTSEDEADAVLQELSSPRKRKRKPAAQPLPEPEMPLTVAPPPAERARPVQAPPASDSPRPRARVVQPAAAPAEEPDLLVAPQRQRPVVAPRDEVPAPVAQLPPANPLPPPPHPVAPPAAIAPSAAELRPAVVAPNPAEQARAEEARPVEPLPARGTEVRALAFGGLWATSGGLGARSWDPAYGVRLGVDRGGWLVELAAARAGSNSGTAYAAASTTRMLVGGHAGYWFFERGPLAAQAGGGVFASFSSTRYDAQDVGGPPQALDGSAALKLAPELGTGLRYRPWKVLELRLDVSALYRDGRLELLPAASAGAWVAF